MLDAGFIFLVGWFDTKAGLSSSPENWSLYSSLVDSIHNRSGSPSKPCNRVYIPRWLIRYESPLGETPKKAGLYSSLVDSIRSWSWQTRNMGHSLYSSLVDSIPDPQALSRCYLVYIPRWLIRYKNFEIVAAVFSSLYSSLVDSIRRFYGGLCEKNQVYIPRWLIRYWRDGS